MKERTASILKRVAKVSLICSLLAVLLGFLGLALSGDNPSDKTSSDARLNLFCLVHMFGDMQDGDVVHFLFNV